MAEQEQSIDHVPIIGSGSDQPGLSLILPKTPRVEGNDTNDVKTPVGGGGVGKVKNADFEQKMQLMNERFNALDLEEDEIDQYTGARLDLSTPVSIYRIGSNRARSNYNNTVEIDPMSELNEEINPVLSVFSSPNHKSRSIPIDNVIQDKKSDNDINTDNILQTNEMSVKDELTASEKMLFNNIDTPNRNNNNLLLKQVSFRENENIPDTVCINDYSSETDNTAILTEIDDTELMEFWIDEIIPNPPELYIDIETGKEMLKTGDEEEIRLGENVREIMNIPFSYPTPPTFQNTFENENKEVSLIVNRLPEDVVRKKKEELDMAIFKDQQLNIEELRKKEADIIWREHLARKRISNLEDEMRKRLLIEKEKLIIDTQEKNKKIGNDFRQAREHLEIGIKRQMVAIKEKFGDILIAGNSLVRRYGIQNTYTPQPIEFRIHLLRAVKTKLPKGAYVMMLTQYESLGGGPIAWSKIGAYGIGDFKSAATNPVRHYGRYFDRVMKFEDSCYALCPPRHMLKPSFTFVLELFQLASRVNPTDRVVAWTAIPMCNEHLQIIDGTFKLPLLRGQQSLVTEHYRSMEKDISKDLNNWLCNCYIEVRRMPLKELEGKVWMILNKCFFYFIHTFNTVVT